MEDAFFKSVAPEERLRADWAVLGLQIALEVDDYPPLLSWQISTARRGQSSQTRRARLFLIHRGVEYAVAPRT